MINKKYYPFERNNYFYGKLLTVKDFNEEQRYVNDKRRLQNFLTAGAGVVSGLDTVVLDDRTISVEAGMALDYQGREIILAESVSKKISVIDGFHGLTDFDNVYLCLSYAEEQRDMMHSISADGEGNNYNRVSEGYKLYLTNYVNEANVNVLENIKYDHKVVFDQKGLKITQSMPRFVEAGKSFDLMVTIEKENLPRAIEIDYSISGDYFTSEDGENHLRIYHLDNDIKAYKKTVLKYKMMAVSVEATKASANVESATSRITIDTDKMNLDYIDGFMVYISKDDYKEEIISSYLKKHFDDLVTQNAETGIYLAKMRFLKQDRDCLIEDFTYLPFGQYVLSNQMLYMLLKDMQAPVAKAAVVEVAPVAAVAAPKEESQKIVSGNETIYVDLKGKNKTYFSDEIAHGLGDGDVILEVALAEAESDMSIFGQNKVYFGDMSVLEGTAYGSNLPQVKTAIISYPDKGTFRIAIKLLENTDNLAIEVKWWAVKNGVSKLKNPSEINGVSVVLDPDTTTVAPKEKYKFNAQVIGSDSQDCHFHVVEENGGQIDISGLYEAPSQEGIYEIVAESVKYPNKKATAFVVVKKR